MRVALCLYGLTGSVEFGLGLGKPIDPRIAHYHHTKRIIEAIENALGKKIQKNMMPLQAGDVPATYANVDDLVRDLDYKPSTSVQKGIDNFVAWYREFFKV